MVKRWKMVVLVMRWVLWNWNWKYRPEIEERREKKRKEKLEKEMKLRWNMYGHISRGGEWRETRIFSELHYKPCPCDSISLLSVRSKWTYKKQNMEMHIQTTVNSPWHLISNSSIYIHTYIFYLHFTHEEKDYAEYEIRNVYLISTHTSTHCYNITRQAGRQAFTSLQYIILRSEQSDSALFYSLFYSISHYSLSTGINYALIAPFGRLINPFHSFHSNLLNESMLN